MSKLYFKIGADYDKVIRLRDEIAKLKRELLSMNQVANPSNFSALERQLRRTSQEFENLVRQAALAATQMRNTTVNINRTTSSLGGMNSMLAKIGGTVALSKLASDIIRVRGEFQAADTAIQTLLGSKEKADALMKQVREYAKISPLEFSDVTAATQMMLGFNIEAEKVPRFISAIGDVSMGEAQKFNSLTLAFSQMSATGKLMGQDLNQMINAGFNPLQQIAQTTGKSIATLKEEMSKGAISTEMVQKAFIDATSAGGKFYQMSENASKTINGQLSMMQDAMDAAFNEMGQKLEGVIMSGIQLTTSLIENYETIGKVLVGMIATYGVYKTALITNIALTRGWVVAVRADATAKGIQTIATKAQTVAQLALNTAMKANPYVLVATLIVGAATAMWAFHDSTTESEKAQGRFNKKQKESIKQEQEHKEKIDSLVESSRDVALADLQRGQSLAELRKEYPKIFEKYDIETIKLADILKLKRQIAEEDAKRAGEKKQKELSDIESEIKYYENLLKALSGQKGIDGYVKKLKELHADRDVLLQEKGKSISEQFISSLKDVDVNNFSRYISELEKRIKGKGENGKVKLRLPIDIKGSLSDEAIYDVKDIKTLIDTAKAAKKTKEDAATAEKKTSKEWLSSYKKAYEDAEKAYKDFLTSKKVMSDADRDKELKRLKDLRDTAKATYERKGGSASSDKKEESAAEKRRKENEKYKLLLSKQALEKIRVDEDLQMQVDESRIKVMEEGSAKTIAQIELNFEREMLVIDRKKEDALRKKTEHKRSAWEANPENKGKSFDTTGIALSDSESKHFDELYKIAIVNNEKAYGDLTNQYLSYVDQRLAIEKKFNDDIAVLQEARKKAEARGNFDEGVKIKRSIAKATADKGKDLMKHDFDVLRQSPEYVRAFEDLKNTSSETLDSLLAQLESAKNTATTVLNPEDLREYTTTIQEIMDELDNRNPFQSLVSRQKELAEAEQELAEAKRQLDAVDRGAKVVTGVKSTSLGKNGKIKIENTYLTAAEALNKYNAAKDKAQRANNNFIKAEKTAKDKVDELADTIKDIGNSIGGTSGEIISLIGDVALFTTGTIDGISKVAQTGANAISSIEKASVILGIISAGIQLMQQLNSILPTADNQYDKYAEKVAEINKLTDAVNEYRVAALEAQQAETNWFSEDNLKNLRDYKNLHDEVADAYKNKAEESQATYQDKSGGGWFTNSWNWFLDNTYGKIWGVDFARKYKEGQTAAVDNLRIETRSRKKGFLGSGIGGRSQETEDLVSWARNNGFGELFDNEGLINKEAADAILNQYGDKLVGQTKETLESLVELREKYDEYLEQLHEYVSSLYEPLVDNFVNSIWDWLDSGKDALASFKEYASDTFRDIANDMLKSIVLSKIFGEGENSYQSKVNKVYDDYAKGLIDEVELNRQVSNLTADLMKNAEEQLPAIQGMAENISNTIKNTSGIDITQTESTSQSSSQKGFAAMSQDTGEELNGRFTALQIVGEEIKNQNIIQSQSLNLLTMRADDILHVNTDMRNIADNTRDLIANSYLELVQISENTGNSAKYLKDIKADISEVKKNTSKL